MKYSCAVPLTPLKRPGSVPADRTDSVFTRATSGDRGALGTLLARCLPAIRRWAHGRLSLAARAGVDTADVVHDALAQTLPRLGSGQLESERALAAYLRRAVANRIHDEHRRIARRGLHDSAPSELASSIPSPLDLAITHESEARYRAALERLRPKERELIVAHIELGYSHAQLGVMTRRTANAARVALQRAVERLLVLMAE